jgi:ADP-ribose pyrophosphatase
MESRNRTTIFTGLVVSIDQLDVRIGSQGWHTFQVIRHPGGVGVLPCHDDGTVTLIRQLRPAIGKEIYEIPAGRLSPGEDPMECGRRELLEETGLRADSLVSLGVIHPSPGVLDEIVHLFAGQGLIAGEKAPEPYEEIETVRLPLQEAFAMACDGRIVDSKTMAALLRLSRLQL